MRDHGAQVDDDAPLDSVGSGVDGPYRPFAHPAFFTAGPPSATVTWVVVDATDGAPVVVHRVR